MKFNKKRRDLSLQNILLEKTPNIPRSPKLPSIHMHIPSYSIILAAKKEKQSSTLSTSRLPDANLIDFTMKNVKSKNQQYEAICKNLYY